MTCQIGSEEPAEHERQHRRHETGLVLDVSPRLRSPPPESADQIHKLAAVMFSKVLFLAAFVALASSISAADAGKFAGLVVSFRRARSQHAWGGGGGLVLILTPPVG